MGKDAGHVHKVTSPKVKYAVLIDDAGEIRDVKAIREFSIPSLTMYQKEYDKEVLDSLNRCDEGFADNSCDTSRDETFQRSHSPLVMAILSHICSIIIQTSPLLSLQLLFILSFFLESYRLQIMAR